MYKTTVLLIEEDDNNVIEMLGQYISKDIRATKRIEGWSTLISTIPVVFPNGKILNGNLYLVTVEDERQANLVVFQGIYLAMTMYGVPIKDYKNIVKIFEKRVDVISDLFKCFFNVK